MTTTTDVDAVREAALDLALATWYDEALRLLDATKADDPRGRVLLALTAADVADRADHLFARVLPRTVSRCLTRSWRLMNPTPPSRGASRGFGCGAPTRWPSATRTAPIGWARPVVRLVRARPWSPRPPASATRRPTRAAVGLGVDVSGLDPRQRAGRAACGTQAPACPGTWLGRPRAVSTGHAARPVC